MSSDDDGAPQRDGVAEQGGCSLDFAGKTLARITSEVEAKAMCHILAQAGGNQRRAAEIAGLSYDAFRKKMKRHGIRPARLEFVAEYV